MNEEDLTDFLQKTVCLMGFFLNNDCEQLRLEEDTAKMASLSLLLIVFALLRVALSHGHRNQTWDPWILDPDEHVSKFAN